MSLAVSGRCLSGAMGLIGSRLAAVEGLPRCFAATTPCAICAKTAMSVDKAGLRLGSCACTYYSLLESTVGWDNEQDSCWLGFCGGSGRRRRDPYGWGAGYPHQ